LVKPERRTITRHVGQPAYIVAFERTSMYPRIAGYIRKWNVDIGDSIKKDQVLAELFVPDLEAEYHEKQAQVVRDTANIAVAEQSVSVAESKLESARANAQKAQADVASFQAAVDRWDSEVKRLSKMVDERVIDRQVLDESQKQLKSNIALRSASDAGVKAAEADIVSRQAEVSKARADVEASRATAKVGEATEQRYAALYAYTQLNAPYDGIVVVRNANTGDFVQPAAGDKSAPTAAVGGGEVQGEPIYVVARTDLVRVFVDVPEMDANHVARGTEAHVRVQALDDADFTATVTRSSWALNSQTRTLRAEIDLPNPDARLLPGMYAYAEVVITRADVMTLPLGAIVGQGLQNVCYVYENGKVMKTPVQIGANDGKWIEVAKRQVGGKWVPFDGSEQIVVGALSEVSDGQKVRVATDTSSQK
jgi:multidrug efflux pump subunit AcrA (membrane-fusion protein)